MLFLFNEKHRGNATTFSLCSGIKDLQETRQALQQLSYAPRRSGEARPEQIFPQSPALSAEAPKF